MRPLALGPNQLPRFYRGGARIARLRGLPESDAGGPEDWVGSTTTAFGEDELGLSRLDDGRTLADAMAADPEAFLGPKARRGGVGVLVKLLDAGERLPVHVHPDRAFAAAHGLGPHGKSEAWIVVAAEGPDPAVHLGLRAGVDADTVAGWVERQDTQAMLGALNRVSVRAGDALFVPAGLPHAIGAGLLIVELQEESDLSVMLEWDGFDLDGARDGHVGLGFDVALGAVDTRPVAPRDLDHLHAPARAVEGRPGVEHLLPAEADEFFHAERIRPRPSAPLTRELSILIVTEGRGVLASEAGELELARGSTVLVPWAAGAARVEGELELLRCLPPQERG